MPSRISYFNKTLFRKNLTRFWPLWGMASFGGALFPLALLMELLRGDYARIEALELTRIYYDVVAYGLPVITTDRCVAGLDLVEDGVNGYIVPVNDAAVLCNRIHAALAGDMEKMGEISLKKIRPYTIENMAKVHMDIFEGRR